MNKTVFRIISVIATLALILGNSFSAGASSAYGANQAVTTIPAFPGAEGFGANSIGGRGGALLEVTNLNDAGAGSLRACVEASGARTCVFKIGGLIVLNSPLTISNPYITIAGQTAPGGGITIKLGTATNAILTETHDVIIRYLTIRTGPGGDNHANQIADNGVEIYNVIIDHNSTSWGVDENIATWYRVNNVTIQWTLISEGLDCSTHSKGCHSKGLMIGGYKGSESGGKGSENISVLNNLMANNLDRNPLLQICGIGQVINNVTYNAGTTYSHQKLNCTTGVSYVNWVNNYHKKGPAGVFTDFKIATADDGTCGLGKTYMSGNVGMTGTWTTGQSGSCAGRTDIFVTVPAIAPAVASTTALSAYTAVLSDAGNSRGISCDGNWVSRRDAIDTRIINDVKNGTGKIIDDPSQVGGWIVPAVGVPCTDSDHDGMSDMWELKYGFNSNISDGSADKDADGYTNVEEYFNGTNPLGSIVVPSVTPSSTPSSTPTGQIPTLIFTPTVTASPAPVLPTATATVTMPTVVVSASPTLTAVVTSTQKPFTPTASPVPTLPPAIPGTNSVDVRVSSGNNDVEENASGWMYVNSSDLELIYDKSTQVVGIRFTGVKIPNGAVVTKAYIQFKVDQTSSQTIQLAINGEASPNASAFTTAARNVSKRARTSSSVTWSPSAWSKIGETGVAQQTPNLKSIVQEIVNQPNWISGNSLVFVVTGTSGQRVAKSFEGDAAGAPLLHVEFSIPASKTATITPTATLTATATATLMVPTTIPTTFTVAPPSPTIVATETQVIVPSPIATLVPPSPTVEVIAPTPTP